ncbi:Fic family protein [Elongatibacter sediminis]|uniref:protein adenylyltransferase n=1 Tax=Elongatibacter sediminis TaxID=3119006 RepID=A0AAW9RFS6_9GAMM
MTQDEIDRLRERVRRNPADGHAWLALSRVLARGPASPELFHASEQAIRSLPDHDEAWLIAARAQAGRSGAEAAAGWLETMARENPGLTAPRRAAAAFRKEVDQASLAHADQLRADARWEEALTVYRRIEPRRPGDALLRNNIGTCLASLEAHEEAAACFKAALERDPALAQARLNLALLQACRGRRDRARRHLADLIASPMPDPQLHRAAHLLMSLLDEHERLAPAVSRAVNDRSVTELRAALGETPPALCEADPDSIARLEAIADSLNGIRPRADAFQPQGRTEALAFLEACALANLADTDDAVTRRHERFLATGPNRPDPDQWQLGNLIGVLRERKKCRADWLQGDDGEAWLRYWHARLIRATDGAGEESGEVGGVAEGAANTHARADAMPGQFKPAPNAIRNLPLTPPERVVGTVRQTLGTILPKVEAGPSRAILAYVAINMIHGFADGNGRLARFVSGWLLETAGLPAVTVPPRLRARFAPALDTAWLQGDAAPIATAFQAAHAETWRQLKQLA